MSKKFFSGLVALAFFLLNVSSTFANNQDLSDLNEKVTLSQENGYTVTKETKTLYVDQQKFLAELKKQYGDELIIFNDAQNSKAVMSGSPIASTKYFSGDGCAKSVNSTSGCVSANGSIYHDLAFENLKLSAGANATSPAQSKIEVVYTQYGLVGGSQVVTNTYTVTSDSWTNIASLKVDKDFSGVVVASRLDVYGKHKETKNGMTAEWTSKADLSEK